MNDTKHLQNLDKILHVPRPKNPYLMIPEITTQLKEIIGIFLEIFQKVIIFHETSYILDPDMINRKPLQKIVLVLFFPNPRINSFLNYNKIYLQLSKERHTQIQSRFNFPHHFKTRHPKSINVFNTRDSTSAHSKLLGTMLLVHCLYVKNGFANPLEKPPVISICVYMLAFAVYFFRSPSPN